MIKRDTGVWLVPEIPVFIIILSPTEAPISFTKTLSVPVSNWDPFRSVGLVAVVMRAGFGTGLGVKSNEIFFSAEAPSSSIIVTVASTLPTVSFVYPISSMMPLRRLIQLVPSGIAVLPS